MYFIYRYFKGKNQLHVIMKMDFNWDQNTILNSRRHDDYFEHRRLFRYFHCNPVITFFNSLVLKL